MRYGRGRRHRFRFKMPRFIPSIATNNSSFYRSKMNFMSNNCYKNKRYNPNSIMTTIGIIIVLIGVLLVFKNTTLYSGVSGGIMAGTGGGVTGVSRGITIGTPCGLEFIILIVGLVFVLYKVNSFIGWTLVSIGSLWFLLAIIMNFKMVFMPMNMLKAVGLFTFIAFGISVIFRGLLKNRR